MKKNNPAPQTEKVKFTGKTVIRTGDIVLIPGEKYKSKDLTGPYFEGLFAQNFFEAVEEAKTTPKPVE